jgi:DNA-binding NarL/FixJ family response regulator
MRSDPILPLLPVEPRRPRPPRTVLAEAGLVVVAEARDSDGAIAAAELHRPGVCLMDADLPGGGILTVRRITYRVPETAVVVLAPVVSSEVLLAAIRAGANGIVAQSANADGVMRAVASVLDGQAAIPRAAIASLIHEFRGGGGKRASIEGRPLSLTERESQVLELLQANLTTAQIAGELGLSQVTVRRHLGAISAKAGGSGRAELASLVQVA